MARKSEAVAVRPLNFQSVTLRLTGTSPYVQHKFSRKAKELIIAAQESGARARSKRMREAKDFDEVYRESMHVSREGWVGIPAACFRDGAIAACRTVGYKMTHAKLALFIRPDGFDADDGTPLVRIQGEPRRHIAPARNADGSVDIRCRPMWESWAADITIEYDADMFSESDVLNLMIRVGRQVGIGEGRPDSKKSAGLGWGLFAVEKVE
jgi:hypothetical protein